MKSRPSRTIWKARTISPVVPVVPMTAALSPPAAFTGTLVRKLGKFVVPKMDLRMSPRLELEDAAPKKASNFHEPDSAGVISAGGVSPQAI